MIIGLLGSNTSSRPLKVSDPTSSLSLPDTMRTAMIPGTATIGEHFPLFGSLHWVVIVGIAVAAALFSLALRRATGRSYEAALCRAVCWSLGGMLACGAVAAQVHDVAAGTWSLQKSLPLDLCDIAVFVVALALLGVGLQHQASRGRPAPGTAAVGHNPVRFGQRLYELAYFWGIGGTVQAVLTPDFEDPIPSVGCVHYFVLHGGIIVSVLVMTIGLRMRPQPGAVWRAWLVTLGLAVLVALIDYLLGANYMYMCGPPANPTLYDVFGPWPWALLSLVLVGTLILVLCYAPFWLIDRHRQRRWINQDLAP